MSNYVKPLPTDTKGASMQELPAPFIANARLNEDNAVASQTVLLHPQTSSLEIGAFGGQGVVIRWVPITETAGVAPAGSVISSGLGANFDHYIPPGTYRRFAVPIEKLGTFLGGQVGSVNGLYSRVAVINAGATASSVLVSEF